MFKIINLTSGKIKKYYKLFGYVSLAYSILILVISDGELEERLSEAIAINFVYHMFYHFFRFPVNFEGKGIFTYEKIGKPMMKLFSIIGVLAAFGLACYIITSMIALEYSQSLWMIFVPVGMFLGSYSTWLSYKKV